MRITICRVAHFNSAHRLTNPSWTDEKNSEVFGLCNNPNYHGHNYKLIVKITGTIDQETGFVMDMKNLKELIDREVVKKFDHKNLNLDSEEFRELNPTAENIAVVIYRLLETKIGTGKKLGIILYETERNYVEYYGE